MKAFKNLLETWDIIEEFDIKNYVVDDDFTIFIPISEFERLMNSVTNQKYIKNLNSVYNFKWFFKIYVQYTKAAESLV